MIRVEKVYRIFGDNAKLAMELLEQGKLKDEIQSETGQVVGVHNVSFELQEGELFVIMGLSGSGKSTLLRCINRLVEPTAGKIYLKADGEEVEITSLPGDRLRVIREKRISMVFQRFALFPHRTVLSNVTFGLEVQGTNKNERWQKAQEILELVGLEGWGDAYPAQLSGGMQQRVGLARALVTGAPVLLMDEPFSALDPLIRVYMQDELLKLQDRFRRTILFVTHDLDEALKLGDRIALMEAGRIVQIGTPVEIIVNPRTEYVARFVENADPSGVLTAGTVATTAGDLQTENGRDYLLKDGSRILLDEDGRPVEGILNGKPVRIQRMEEESEGRNAFIAVGENTPLRKIMEVRMDYAGPIIAVSDEGKFKGVVTEQNVLRGLLEKGRGKGE